MDEKEIETSDQIDVSGDEVSQGDSIREKKPFSVMSIVLFLIVAGLLLFTFFGLIEKQKASNEDVSNVAPQEETLEYEVINYQPTEDEIEINARIRDLDNNVLSVMDFDHNGVYFVDGSNYLTLYMEWEEGSCVDECLEGMVPYTTEYEYEIPAGVKANYIEAVLNPATGLYQYTWNGKKLYHFSDDVKSGSLLGDGHSMAFTLARP